MRHALRLLAAAAVAFASSVGDASAQRTVSEQELKALDAYRGSDTHLAGLFKAIDQLEGVIRGACGKINIEGPVGSISILGKPSFGAEGKPDGGKWRERWQLDRCGKKVVYNIIVTARPDGKPIFEVLVPGVTKTVMDPKLQGQVVNQVLARTVEQIPDCRLPLVADTFVTQDTQGVKYDAEKRLIDGNWRETWVVFACGQEARHKIKFDITEKHAITMELEG